MEQTEGAELPTLREMTGPAGENRERLVSFIDAQGIELDFTDKIAPALGLSYGGKIAILPGQSEAEGIQHPCSRTRARDVAQGRAQDDNHQGSTGNRGRGYRLCDWQS